MNSVRTQKLVAEQRCRDIEVAAVPRKLKSQTKTTAVSDKRSVAPKKKRAPRKGQTTVAPKPTNSPPRITDGEIRTRAYFIAEHRLQHSIPGDASADWVEARRQLIAESRPD